MLKRWIISLLLNAIALIAVSGLFQSFHLDGFGAALFASFILSILNVFIKPVLIILTLPITIFTFGLFLIVINAITLMLAQALMGTSFVIQGFGMAIVAAIIISILNMVLNSLVKDSFRR